MITAETLRKCSYLSNSELQDILQKSYPKDRVLFSNFLGVTNGGQFCYDVVYPTEEGTERGKVFVWQKDNEIFADY